VAFNYQLTNYQLTNYQLFIWHVEVVEQVAHQADVKVMAVAQAAVATG